LSTRRRPKRLNGEGSIWYSKQRRRWVAELTLPNGKRQRLFARTQEDAVDRRNKAIAAGVDGVMPGDAAVTVAAWFKRWMTDSMPRSVSEGTLRNYNAILDAYIIPHVGRVKLGKLTPAHVEHMMRNLEDDGLSPRTVALARTVLRRGLGAAVRQGTLKVNVAALTEPPKGTPPRLDDALTAEETAKVLRAVKGDRLEALAYVVLGVGLRRGEAVALRWDDLDLERGLLAVRTAKTAARARTIAIPAPTVAALKAHRKRQREERVAGRRWDDPGLVFTTSIGTPIDGRNALRWWHELTERAGIGRRRFHASRHTAATLMLDAGVPLEDVSATLGHSGYAITADVYAKVLPPKQREAAVAMEQFLDGSGKRPAARK
jgi:integrase